MERQKKRKIFLGVAGAIMFGVLFATGSLGQGSEAPAGPWREERVEGSGSHKVAIINIEGEIVSAGDALARNLAVADDIVSQLRQANQDDAVEAVILRINTSGGSVVASDQILSEIAQLRDNDKPVVAALDEVAASGGYLIATGADRITANPSTITGSIGAIMVLMNVEEAAGKLGIEPVVIKSGRFKDIGSPFTEMSRQEREMLQDVIDQAHQRFIDFVAEGREMDRSEVEDLADGRIISGADALDSGLVDEIGDLDEAVVAAKDLADLDEARVVEYSRPFSPLDLLGGMGARLGLVDEVERSLTQRGPVLKYMWAP